MHQPLRSRLACARLPLPDTCPRILEDLFEAAMRLAFRRSAAGTALALVRDAAVPAAFRDAARLTGAEPATGAAAALAIARLVGRAALAALATAFLAGFLARLATAALTAVAVLVATFRRGVFLATGLTTSTGASTTREGAGLATAFIPFFATCRFRRSWERATRDCLARTCLGVPLGTGVLLRVAVSSSDKRNSRASSVSRKRAVLAWLRLSRFDDPVDRLEVRA